MRDRLIELKRKFVENFDCGGCYPENEKCGKCLTEKEADYLLANGVIVPPCKVGDTVYEIHNENPFEEELQVMESKVECFLIGTSLDTHRIDGKTVFLTKEDAENALKARERE